MAKVFIDTNVLLYAVSTSSGDAAKAAIARRILESMDALGHAKIPVIDLDDPEIESELSGARRNHRRG